MDGWGEKKHKTRNVYKQREEAFIEQCVVVVVLCSLFQVVHGDLTTSNFMVRNGSERVVAIDFGLASQQPLPEDKVGDRYSTSTVFLVVSRGTPSETTINTIQVIVLRFTVSMYHVLMLPLVDTTTVKAALPIMDVDKL